MKLSENMLNFLGYMVEAGGFCSESLALGLASRLGVASALKNSLIERYTYTWHQDPDRPFPGMPLGGQDQGFRLLSRGRELGELGRLMRSRDLQSDEKGCQLDRGIWERRKAALVKEGQAKLKEWAVLN